MPQLITFRLLNWCYLLLQLVVTKVLLFVSHTCRCSSSKTQGQIVGARESLNGRKNMARRKVKNGEKSPWGQNVLADQFQTVAAVLPSDWVEKHKSFLAPIRGQNGGARLDFPSPPLSAPGSPSMIVVILGGY